MGFDSRKNRTSEGYRVVVSGVGVISPIGSGWEANAAGFRAGKRALQPVDLFDVTRQKAKSAGQVNLPERIPPTRLSARQEKRIDRSGAMLLAAASEAFTASGWEIDAFTEPVHVCLGTSAGSMTLGEEFYRVAVEGRTRRHQAERIRGYQTHRQAMNVCEGFGVNGPVTIISNACSSGANAIGHAFRMVQMGHARRAVAGGYDALCEMVFAGFDSLNALSTTAPRPFAIDRDGLALGEGACLFCIERLDDAQSRGGKIYSEIGGYGASTDLHHLTQPHPEGNAALISMNMACDGARINPDQVGYINSHGTGTPLNDSAEANAISRWAGGSSDKLAVSSTKGGIGHLLGGAGAVEAAVCLMAMDGGWIPPGVPVEEIDPACKFDLVQSPREMPELDVTLTNSFGFGGANASLVLKKITK